MKSCIFIIAILQLGICSTTYWRNLVPATSQAGSFVYLAVNTTNITNEIKLLAAYQNGQILSYDIQGQTTSYIHSLNIAPYFTIRTLAFLGDAQMLWVSDGASNSIWYINPYKMTPQTNWTQIVLSSLATTLVPYLDETQFTLLIGNLNLIVNDPLTAINYTIYNLGCGYVNRNIIASVSQTSGDIIFIVGTSTGCLMYYTTTSTSPTSILTSGGPIVDLLVYRTPTVTYLIAATANVGLVYLVDLAKNKIAYTLSPGTSAIKTITLGVNSNLDDLLFIGSADGSLVQCNLTALPTASTTASTLTTLISKSTNPSNPITSVAFNIRDTATAYVPVVIVGRQNGMVEILNLGDTDWDIIATANTWTNNQQSVMTFVFAPENLGYPFANNMIIGLSLGEISTLDYTVNTDYKFVRSSSSPSSLTYSVAYNLQSEPKRQEIKNLWNSDPLPMTVIQYCVYANIKVTLVLKSTSSTAQTYKFTLVGFEANSGRDRFDHASLDVQDPDGTLHTIPYKQLFSYLYKNGQTLVYTQNLFS